MNTNEIFEIQWVTKKSTLTLKMNLQYRGID